MGKIVRVISGAAAAGSLSGAVAFGVAGHETWNDHQTAEEARSQQTVLEAHEHYADIATDEATLLITNALGFVAMSSAYAASAWWGIRNTREFKPVPLKRRAQ